jgi:hypothetical protein
VVVALVIRRRFTLRETIATIIADSETHIEAARKAIMEARRQVEAYIAEDPFFAITLEPYDVVSTHLTVRRMADAASVAGVGPMAAVAGAIAWAGVEEMVRSGATFGLVDNGGDIVCITDREIRVGIYAGQSEISGRFAFVIPPADGITGICTSSATVGHSFSSGTADSVTVFSENPAVADAWATSICNQITAEDPGLLERLDLFGVRGVFVIIGAKSISFGDLPALVRAQVDEDLITGGIL